MRRQKKGKGWERAKGAAARRKGADPLRLPFGWEGVLLLAVLGGILITLLLGPGLLGWRSGSSKSSEGAEALPLQGDPALLRGVQTFPLEGRQHVPQGSPIEYRTYPPTSGPHYPRPASAGFYTQPLPYGNLVHSLEHGAVVIYYDPARISPEAEQSLRALAQAHRDPWASVIVVPNPEPDPQAAYILTAWRVMLRMDAYDPSTVRAFLAEYLGRGPERRVR